MTTIALITAGGIGSRMNQKTPKQFMYIEDKPLIIYTLEAFQQHPGIDAIVVICLTGWEQLLETYAKNYGITKLTAIAPGGKNGQDSIKNGLETIERAHFPVNSTILIHDGNRGLVSQAIISDALSTYAKHLSAVAYIPCTEVIFQRANDKSTIEIPRESLLRTQTPHIFSLQKLLWAHQQAKQLNITDSPATCSLMAQLGQELHFYPGSEKNIKITTQDDIDIFKALLYSRN